MGWSGSDAEFSGRSGALVGRVLTRGRGRAAAGRHRRPCSRRALLTRSGVRPVSGGGERRKGLKKGIVHRVFDRAISQKFQTKLENF